MRSFFALIKRWSAIARQYIWVAVIVYVIHLSIEGFIVNVFYYKVLAPLL